MPASFNVMGRFSSASPPPSSLPSSKFSVNSPRPAARAAGAIDALQLAGNSGVADAAITAAEEITTLLPAAAAPLTVAAVATAAAAEGGGEGGACSGCTLLLSLTAPSLLLLPPPLPPQALVHGLAPCRLGRCPDGSGNDDGGGQEKKRLDTPAPEHPFATRSTLADGGGGNCGQSRLGWGALLLLLLLPRVLPLPLPSS